MEKLKRHYVIGTAGHIDHGKTALVKHLTGKDTDWLKEEKERGMTIDLGFAFMGEDITIIDVPGHEKFVRNMVAGVSTIDLVLLVIAADDGIMPQTREHLDILKLLQIKQGIVVVTKIDLVEKDWLDLVIEEIKGFVKDTFLERSPVIPVSNTSGAGIDQLKTAIFEKIVSTEYRQDKGIFRMPIDRIFTMKGFGTVAAGTVLSGSLRDNQNVDLLPQGKKLRVRGLQIHEHNVKQVNIGDRAAINLAGIEKNMIHRGNVLAEPDFYQATKYFDGNFYLLEAAPRILKHNDRIRLNIGTNEVIGRISILDKNEILPGQEAYMQFRLEKPIVADVGDRYVVRTYSPVVTIGGGVVLDTNPRKHRRFSEKILTKIKKIENGSPELIIEQLLVNSGYQFLMLADISKKTALNMNQVKPIIEELEKKQKCFRYTEKGQDYFLHGQLYKKLNETVIQKLSQFHTNNPTRKGIARNELKVLLNLSDALLFNSVLNYLSKQGRIAMQDNFLALSTHKIKVSEDQKILLTKLAGNYFREAFSTSNIEEMAAKMNVTVNSVKDAVSILFETGELINIGEGILLHNKRIEEAKAKIEDFFTKHTMITVAEFRQLINSSRKYAVPLLNYFDSLGFTVRQQNVRVLNKD